MCPASSIAAHQPPRARMEIRGSSPRSADCARRHVALRWFSRPRLMTVCPYLLPTCSRVQRCRTSSCLPRSGDKDGYAVGFVPCHQRPGDARHPAGEGHGDQHARLARQHSGQPRVLRAAPPGRPSPSRRRSTGAGDRGDPSSISSRASASRRSNSGGEPSPARLRSPGRTGSSPTTARRPGSPSPSTIRSPACSSAASSARLHAPAHAVPAPSPRFSRRVRQSERRTARPAPEPGPQPRIGIVNCLRQPPAAARGRYRHRQGNGQSPVRPAR